MVLRTKNFNIFGGSLKDPTFRGRILKTQYIGGDCLKRRAWVVCWFKGDWQERRGWCFRGRGGWYPNTHYLTMIILSHLELLRIYLPKLNSNILMVIVTIPVGQVDEFYFYTHYSIKAWLFEKIIFELVYLFHIVLKPLVSY